MGDPEVLEVGDGRRAPPSRAVRVLLLVAVVLLAAVALIVDRELRQREERAVEGCAAEVATAVDLAGRRVQTTYEYVRPALSNAPSPALRAGLLGLVSEAAQGEEAQLADARRSCSDVAILPTHGQLRERRDRCLEVLDAQRSRLIAVARDGSEVQAWLDAPRRC